MHVESASNFAGKLPADLAGLMDAFFGSAPGGFGVIDADLRFVHVNEALATLHGVPRVDHPGRLISEVLPRLNDAVMTGLQKILRTGEVGVFATSRPRRDDPDQTDHWLLGLHPIHDENGEIIGVVVLAREVTEGVEAEARRALSDNRTRLLGRSGELLAAGLEVSAVQNAVCDLLVPALAPWAAIWSYDGREITFGQIRTHNPEVSARWRDVLPDLPLSIDDPYGPGRAIQTGQTLEVQRMSTSQLAPLLQDEMLLADAGRIDGRNILTVPLRARGRIIGAVTLVSSFEHGFDTHDRSLAESVCSRAALALDNAQLYEQQHGVALTLQHSMLPRRLPEVSGFDLAFRYLPAEGTEVGGDLYDAVLLQDGRLAVVVGDVMGRGIRAAAVMGQLRASLRGYALEGHSPAGVLARVDGLVQALEDGELVTAVCGSLDPETGAGLLASAGHLPPLQLTATGGVRPLDLPPAVPLGVGGCAFTAVAVQLEPGDSLVLFTDGLVEDRATPVQEGLDKLAAALAADPSWRGQGPEAVCEAALQAMRPAPGHDDDIAMLVVTRTG